MTVATSRPFPFVFMDRPWQLAMGLSALAPARWLDIDEQLDHELALKRDLLRERPDEVLIARECAAEASAELLALLVEHLPGYHPRVFAADAHGLVVRRTGERVRVDDPAALMRAGLLIQEDLCLLADDGRGSYLLEAAFLCFPMRWRLRDKIGLPLRGIHDPVPGFDPRLAGPVDRYMASITPDRPAWRANWSLTDDPTLYQPTGRTRPIEPVPQTLGRALHLRVERQTLRRLPRTGYILFGIRTYVCSLDRLAAVPRAAAALADRLGEMPESILRYKNLLAIRPMLLDWLARAAARRPLEDTASVRER